MEQPKCEWKQKHKEKVYAAFTTHRTTAASPWPAWTWTLHTVIKVWAATTHRTPCARTHDGLTTLGACSSHVQAKSIKMGNRTVVDKSIERALRPTIEIRPKALLSLDNDRTSEQTKALR